MADLSPDDDIVKYWKDQIESSEKETRKWYDRCKKIAKRYRDDRDASQENQRRLNILWSNVQTLKPSLYGRQPVPVVERRFLDRDETGRLASIMLERSIRYNLEDSCFHTAVSQAVLDRLLYARGTAWVRYDPTIAPEVQTTNSTDAEEAQEQQPGQDAQQAQPAEQLLGESVKVDFVGLKDFYTFPAKARTWEEVEAVARRTFLSREELVERFPDEGEKVQLDHKPEGQNVAEELSKATTYEIWDKTKGQVVFIAQSHGKPLEAPKPDPLHLDGFFPCPRPIYGTLTNDSLIPVPDYVEYQDQALELDTLSNRIAMLTKALKVAGAYDASAPGLARIMEEDCENELIPVNAWSAFAEKGGLQGAIAFLPIKEVAAVLAQLLDAREKIKQDLYEITGIADIVRGQSDPNETARAQAIKGRFATMRLQEQQKDVARFCCELMRIMGELIAEHFSPQTLVMTSGILNDDMIMPEVPKQPDIPQPQPGMPPEQAIQMQQQAQMAMQQYQQQAQAVEQQRQNMVSGAIALLRNEKLRGFRIEIETDTTIADDATDEKQSRNEFVTAMASFLKPALEAGKASPELVPLLSKMLLFVVRGYRTGRDLEAAFEDYADKAEKQVREQAKNPNAMAQNPDAVKAQAEIQKAQIEAQSEQTNAQLGMQSKQIDIQIKELDAKVAAMQANMDAQLKAMEHQYKMREMEMQHHSAMQQATALPAAGMPPNNGQLPV